MTVHFLFIAFNEYICNIMNVLIIFESIKIPLDLNSKIIFLKFFVVKSLNLRISVCAVNK